MELGKELMNVRTLLVAGSTGCTLAPNLKRKFIKIVWVNAAESVPVFTMRASFDRELTASTADNTNSLFLNPLHTQMFGCVIFEDRESFGHQCFTGSFHVVVSSGQGWSYFHVIEY